MDMQMIDSSESNVGADDDAERLFCTVLFSEDRRGEKWAQCCKCRLWAHEECGGEEEHQYGQCPEALQTTVHVRLLHAEILQLRHEGCVDPQVVNPPRTIASPANCRQLHHNSLR
ncbi:hypothetical protein PR048_028670, partial [Dryococelus australis]